MTSFDLTFYLTYKLTECFRIIFDTLPIAADCVSLRVPGAELEGALMHTHPHPQHDTENTMRHGAG